MKKLMKILIVVGVFFVLSIGVVIVCENYFWIKFKSNLDVDGIDEFIYGFVFVGMFVEDDCCGDFWCDFVVIFVIYGKGIIY